MAPSTASNDTVYQFRLGKQEKEESFSVIKSYGMKPSQAIRMFLQEVWKTKKIPLSLDYTPNEKTKKVLRTPKEKLGFTPVENASDLLKI